MAREVGVEGEEDLVAVLEFYNSLGLLAYWGEAALLPSPNPLSGGSCGRSEVLRNTVIFSPSTFLSLVAQLTSPLLAQTALAHPGPTDCLPRSAVCRLCEPLGWSPDMLVNHTAHCTLHTALCTLHTAHCTL